MKTTKKILFCLCSVLLLLNSLELPASNHYGEPEKSENLTQLHRKTGHLGPRSVESCIYCYYYNSELSFDSYDDITNFTVSVTDESNGRTAMFYLPDMSETVGISLTAGTYKIVLRTFDGQEFEGVLTISE